MKPIKIKVEGLPRGFRIRVKNKFLIITPTATFQVFGNRMKLKRAWKRHPVPLDVETPMP